MKAGRKLDRLIAEHVMGWKKGRKFANGNGEWIIDGKVDFRTWDLTPDFSTKIEAAWWVVEKMKAEGMVVIIKADGLRTGDYNPGWTVLVDNQSRTDADTAPHAICLAALKAVGVEVPA